MFQLIRYRIGSRDAAHRVVPPKLFCASLEVTPEYWRDSIPERANFLPSPSTRSDGAPSVGFLARDGFHDHPNDNKYGSRFAEEGALEQKATG
jgi:hypothetical protein